MWSHPEFTWPWTCTFSTSTKAKGLHFVQIHHFTTHHLHKYCSVAMATTTYRHFKCLLKLMHASFLPQLVEGYWASSWEVGLKDRSEKFTPLFVLQYLSLLSPTLAEPQLSTFLVGALTSKNPHIYSASPFLALTLIIITALNNVLTTHTSQPLLPTRVKISASSLLQTNTVCKIWVFIYLFIQSSGMQFVLCRPLFN